MKIEPLTFFAAQTAFSSYLTADEVFFLRIHQEGTHLLGAFHGETPLGIISWHQKADDEFQVDYVVVLEHARLQGVCFQLFKACFSFVRQAGGRLITCALIQQTPFGTVMDEWLQKIGFHPAMSMRIIGCDMTDGNSAGWKEFMRTRGARYFLRGEKKGFSVVSYAEAKTSALRELEYEIGKSFPAYLSPFPYWEQTILDCSFLTLKDGSPIAYTSITENAGSAY